MFTDTEVNEGLFTILCTQDIDDSCLRSHQKSEGLRHAPHVTLLETS